jgi:outer membrane autotransporter protein
MPYAVDTANYRIAVVDPTGFGLADEVLEDTVDTILTAVARRFRAPATAGDVSVLLPAGETVIAAADRVSGDRSVWTEILGAWRDQDKTVPAQSADHQMAGFVTGVDGVLSDAARAGLFLGASRSALSIGDDTQEIETDSYYAGVYLNHEWGPYFADVVLLTAWQQNGSSRYVANNMAAGGIEVADASYGGGFLAPEITLGRKMAGVTPSVSLGYVGLFLESYTEDGLSELTVDSRSIHALKWRAQLELTRHHSSADGAMVRVEPRLGIEGRMSLGENSVSAQLLGEAIPAFAAGSDDPVASIFAGAAAVWNSARDGLSLRFGADTSVGSDGSFILSAGLGGELAF